MSPPSKTTRPVRPKHPPADPTWSLPPTEYQRGHSSGAPDRSLLIRASGWGGTLRRATACRSFRIRGVPPNGDLTSAPSGLTTARSAGRAQRRHGITSGTGPIQRDDKAPMGQHRKKHRSASTRSRCTRFPAAAIGASCGGANGFLCRTVGLRAYSMRRVTRGDAPVALRLPFCPTHEFVPPLRGSVSCWMPWPD